MKKLVISCGLAALSVPAVAQAQPGAPPPPMLGIRLDVVGTGEVQRAPDQVTINAGVVTRAAEAEAALRDNAAQMTRVRGALQRAGIAERDIQTGSISLSQDYRPDPATGEGRPIGFVANNSLEIRFRDVARAGRIIDALVAAGVNNVNGPSFDVSGREAALDEARAQAVTAARTRAALYARALGTRVRRIVAVSEVGPVAVAYGAVANQSLRQDGADTQIVPGTVQIRANVTVTFELDQPAG